MTRHVAPVFASLALCSSALAAPLDKSWLTDEVSWLIHLDLDRIMDSRLAKEALGEDMTLAQMLREEMDLDINDLQEIEEAVPREILHAFMTQELDIERDFHAVTVFGQIDRDEPDAIILETSAAVDKVIARMQPIDQVEAVQGRDLTLVMIEDEDTRLGDANAEWSDVIAAIRPNLRTGGRSIVLGDSIEDIVLLLDHQDRQRRANAGPRWADPTPGAMVFVFADARLAAMHGHDHAHMLEKAEAVLFEFGEDGEDFFAAAEITASDAQAAQSMVMVANGLIGMGNLMLANEPEAQAFMPILRSLSVSSGANSSVVSLGMRMKIDEVTALMNELHESGHEFRHEHHHTTRLESKSE